MNEGVQVEVSGLPPEVAAERTRVVAWIARAHGAIVDNLDEQMALEGPAPEPTGEVTVREKWAMLAILETVAKEIAAGDHGLIEIRIFRMGGST